MAVAESGLYDLQQVKRLLDDEAIAMMEVDYEESVTALYVKIVMGTIAVIAAVYSHFNPWSFPDENYRLIVSCVIIYGVCAGVMQLVSFFLEGQSFYSGVLSPRKMKVKGGELAHRIWLSSTLSDKSGSSIYKLMFHNGAREKPRATMAHGYEKYLTSKGTFLRDVFRADLAKEMKSFNSKKDN